MPKRKSSGKYRTAPSPDKDRRGRNPSGKWAAGYGFVERLECRTLLSHVWYVSTLGSDGGPGTLAHPFQTIERAAAIANWGDTVVIRGGVYRETVHPAHGGVSFTAYGNEDVIVTGADAVTGWSQYSGNIYEAAMPWDLGEGNNQVFIGSQMLNEARWPNTSTNLSSPTLATIQSGGGPGNTVTIYDGNLSGGWTGASIHIMPGAGWYAQTGTVIASAAGTLTFTYSSDESYTQPRSLNQYYLYGKFQALDSPGEWYLDNQGHLYLWAPNNANPNTLGIAVKHRDYAFDLSGDPNITLNGINIIAATIKTDAGSTNLVINHMNASYISQFTWESIGWQQPVNTGIELNGDDSLLENSTIAWSAGDGVFIGGANCRVTGNVIHDVDYNAGQSAPVRIMGNGAMVDHNLIYNAGRDGILIKAWNSQVLSNTIHDVMLQTSDGGAIYTVSQDGTGSLIANNLIYSLHEHVPGSEPTWFSANGIYLDNSASNWVVEYNQVTDSDGGIKMNFSSTGNKILNNALGGTVGSIIGSDGNGSWAGTLIQDNTLYDPAVMQNPGATYSGNTLVTATVSGSAHPAASADASASVGAAPAAPVDGSPSPSSSQAASSTGASTPGTTGAGTPPSSQNPPTPQSAFAPIAAGMASGSYGTLPLSDGSVVGLPGDWLRYASLDFGKGSQAMTLQLAGFATSGSKVQLRIDSATGPLITTLQPIPSKRGKTARAQIAHVKKVTGVHDVYVLIVGRKGQVEIQSFQFLAASHKR